MKKIGKLSINPDKIIKNEELVNLRGGYNIACMYYSDETNYPGSFVCCELKDSSSECSTSYELTTTASVSACSESERC